MTTSFYVLALFIDCSHLGFKISNTGYDKGGKSGRMERKGFSLPFPYRIFLKACYNNVLEGRCNNEQFYKERSKYIVR